MWPQLLDMTKEESVQSLRSLELEAYASLVTALRAQGPLNQSKLKILKETSALLNITQERHKAEIRRAVSDEKLNTIAYHVCGHNTYLDEWAQEGRWLVPLMQRSVPQTAFSIIADEVAESASSSNKQLPYPAMTERKRTQNQHMQGAAVADNKPLGYRLPESPKMEDCRKRKLAFCPETSGLVQYPMGPPKISKIQQIYRQRTKAKVKEQQQQQQIPLKIKQEPDQRDQMTKKLFITTQAMYIPQNATVKMPLSPQSTSPKINVLQNITVPLIKAETKEETHDNVAGEQNEEVEALSPQPSCSNENQAPKLQKPVIATIKTSQGLVLKPGEVHKSIKICLRKAIAKSVSPGQKLIVVSTAQSVTSSVLHRALTVPIVKNLDKFKIVSPTTGAATLPITAAKTMGANSIRHKVVTVRTNALPKKVSLSHLQVLNAKGGIKVLPFGGKIITKTTTIPTSNLIIVNSTESNNITKSITSTPVIMTPKPQEPEVLAIRPAESGELTEEKPKEEQKSSVLAEILKASGVTTSDSENCEEETDNQEVLQTEQYIVQDEVVQQHTDGTPEETFVVGEEQVEENGEHVEVSVENVVCEENNVEHTEQSFHESGATYMILDQEENTTNELIVQDENSVQDEELDETKVNYAEEGIFQQCVINEGVVMCSDNAICTKVPSDSVIYSDD